MIKRITNNNFNENKNDLNMSNSMFPYLLENLLAHFETCLGQYIIVKQFYQNRLQFSLDNATIVFTLFATLLKM